MTRKASAQSARKNVPAIDRSPEPSEVVTVAARAWVGEKHWERMTTERRRQECERARAALDAAREPGNIVHDEISAAWRRADAYKAEAERLLAVLGEIHRRTTPQGDAGNRVAYQLSGHALSSAKPFAR